MAAMVVAPKASRLERNTMASCFSASPISTRRNLLKCQELVQSQRLLEHGLVKLPRSMFIGVGQLGLVLLHRLFEFPARKQFQHLRENAAYFHKAESPVVELVLPEPNPTLSGTQPLTGRRSPLRPAVSPLIWTAMIGDELTTHAKTSTGESPLTELEIVAVTCGPTNAASRLFEMARY